MSDIKTITGYTAEYMEDRLGQTIAAADDLAVRAESAAALAERPTIEVMQTAIEQSSNLMKKSETDLVPSDVVPAWGIQGADDTVIDVLNNDGTLTPNAYRKVQRELEGSAAWGILGTDDTTIDLFNSDGTLTTTPMNNILSVVNSSNGFDRITTSQETAHIGTSLTAGANATAGNDYPSQLSLMTGYPKQNHGWSGRNSFVFAAAWGAQPLLTTASFDIPTSGVVRVNLNVEYGGAQKAIISGIKGSLARVTPLVADFTPDVYPSSPISLPARTPIQIIHKIDISDKILIMECSRNNDPFLPHGVVISHIKLLVQALTKRTLCPRVLIMGEPIGGSNPDYPAAVSRRVERNQAIQAAFPEWYVPAFEWLLTQACADYLGITWTANDLQDISENRLPRQLRINTSTQALDILHPNDLGYKAIAYQLKTAMEQRGWI